MKDWCVFLTVSRHTSSIAALADQRAQRPHHGAPEHDLRVLAHGRRRVHRARADHRPGQPPVVQLRLHETVNTTGFGGAGRQLPSSFWFVFGLGLLMAQYTITGFDASAHMAEETQQASRMAAVGMYMSVVASVVFGWILLLAVTFAIPSTEGAHRRTSASSCRGSGPSRWARTGPRSCSSSAWSRSSSASRPRSRRRRG